MGCALKRVTQCGIPSWSYRVNGAIQAFQVEELELCLPHTKTGKSAGL